MLTGFAKNAESYKAFAMARPAWQMLLDHYEAGNRSAMLGLGFKQVKGEWQAPAADAKPVADGVTAPNRTTIQNAWNTLLKKLAKMHRELGIALLADGEEMRGRFHLERTIEIDGDDAEAHRQLGHEEIAGFRGTAEQVAFVKRMQALGARAKEIAAAAIDVQDLPSSSMPAELLASKLPFVGAKSANHTYWVVGSVDEARAMAEWSERAGMLLEELLGPKHSRTMLVKRPRRWVAVVRDDLERDTLITASPTLLGKRTVAEAKMMGGFAAQVGGGWVELSWHRAETDADRAVAHATKRGLASMNDGLHEGLVHTMTWLLCGSTLTGYMDIAATSTGKEERDVRDPAEWRKRLLSEIAAHKDWPLVQVPRERHENFRESVRYKAWSFTTWLVCRHPDEWPTLMTRLDKQPLTAEEVAAIVLEVLGRSVDDAEMEWREWAKAGSRIGKASGLGG